MRTINTYYQDKSALKEFIEQHYDILFAQNSMVLLQIFSGLCDFGFLKRLSLEIAELVPQAHVIGTTTAGEIMNGAVSGLESVLSFSVFQHTDIRCALVLKDGKVIMSWGNP